MIFSMTLYDTFPVFHLIGMYVGENLPIPKLKPRPKDSNRAKENYNLKQRSLPWIASLEGKKKSG